MALLTTNAIYHAAFGDLSKILETLQELAIQAEGFAQPVTRALHLRRAAFGLARYGDIDQARNLLTECLETFDRLDLSQQSVVCIEELGLIAQWSGDYSKAQEWIDRANSLHQKTGDNYCAAVGFELSVLLGFETNDRRFLPKFDIPRDVAEALSRSKRGRQSVLSLQLAHALVRGETDDIDALVSPLMELHAEMHCRGYQDQIVSILASALIAAQRRETAASLLSDYVTHSRRETKELPDGLRKVRANAGLSDNVVA